MSDERFQSALAGSKPGSGTISLTSIEDRGMIDLRGEAGDKKFAAAAKKVLGIALPTKPRTSASKDGIVILWLSVDQWLITCPQDDTSVLHEKLEKALGDIHSLCVIMSDARTIIRLSGKGAREVIMKGAPVDLTTGEYNQGTVRRLRFAELAAMVHIISDEDETIDLYVFRSCADYVWKWLVETSTRASELHVFTKQHTSAV